MSEPTLVEINNKLDYLLQLMKEIALEEEDEEDEE